MAVQPTLNSDLEQAIYRAALKEKRLRRRSLLFILLPVLAGLLWLGFSGYEVDNWRTRSVEIQREGERITQQQEEVRNRAAAADADKKAAQARADSALQEKKAARQQADDMQQRLVKVRQEVGALGVLLTELNSARVKAAKLNASEAVESQLMDIRGALSSSLNRIQLQIDEALSVDAIKAHVYIFIGEERQRDIAVEAKAQIESTGLGTATIAKNGSRKADSTEVCYFRDPQDKDEARQIASILAKHLKLADARITFLPNSEYAGGARNFQVWFGKSSRRGE